MKILIISWFFPPANTMGALRIGKLAHYLDARGHNVHVLTAGDIPRPNTLVQEFSEDLVCRTRWLDINAVSGAVIAPLRMVLSSRLGRRRRVREPQSSRGLGGRDEGNKQDRKPKRRLSDFYQDVTNFPDSAVGWLPYAVKAACRTIKKDRPDIIFATAPPFSALCAGRILKQLFDIPFVAELRDRWADDSYYPPPPWRQKLDMWLEKAILGSADALVTVSDPWASHYKSKYEKPVLTVYNGFDPEDVLIEAPGSVGNRYLDILHTGRIYPGRRDPSPLFRALNLLRKFGKDGIVRVRFLGGQWDDIMPLAEACQVADLIETHPLIPHEQSLVAQRQADILLLLQWNHPSERGNVPGKLFEYLAARRPILALGPEEGVPATIIRERGAGFFSNDAERIADQLGMWTSEKKLKGILPPVSENACAGFSRRDQFSKLEPFFERLIL